MTGLAPDPAVPRRDALLRPATVGAIVSRRLLGGVPAERCEVLHVKYRVGESLRATYRFSAGERDGIVALRTFPPGASQARYRLALAASGPNAVTHAPEAGAVLWVFPHDRRLTALARLADPRSLLPGCAEARVVAYAAERSATAQCRDARGAVLGYAKVGGRDEARLTARVHAALGDHPLLRVPRVLAADDDKFVLVALAGRRLDGLGPAALKPLGAALAALHALPLALAPFTRLDLVRLATAAGVVARARPDVAGRAARLLARLEAAAEDGRRPAVCLHGDANLRNAILLGDGRVGVIDLEHVSAGPAAADLGQLLAGLLGRADRRAASAALLAGYARVAPPPDRAALRWHTAASVLARVAVPAVGRVRPATLARLPELLDAAAGLVAPRGGPSGRARRRPAASRGGCAVKPALLFYCQHSVGLGHLMRSYALCARLAERFRVVLLCGGELPAGIPTPDGIEIVALPPLGVEGGRFGSRDRRLSTERAWALRSERIQATLQRTRPSVVLVELFPFGRAKFARELVPLLRAARAMGAFTGCSLRDILVSGRDDQRAHDNRARALADEHLDAVLVHGDPGFARLEDTFAPTRPLRVPVHYTGFVTNIKGSDPFRRWREDVIVVSAGGGRVGAPLARAAIEAHPVADLRMRVVAGPLMPDDAFARLPRRDGVEIVRSVPDLGAELARARASLSQCGYNTALAIVRARVPALVVPYAPPGEDEQTRRARRLAARGALLVHDGRGPLKRALERLLDFTPATAALDLDGARRTTELLWELRPVLAA